MWQGFRNGFRNGGDIKKLLSYLQLKVLEIIGQIIKYDGMGTSVLEGLGGQGKAQQLAHHDTQVDIVMA